LRKSRSARNKLLRGELRNVMNQEMDGGNVSFDERWENNYLLDLVFEDCYAFLRKNTKKNSRDW